MDFPKIGDEVFVKGRVIRTHNLTDDVDPAYQSVQVQTPDGQGILTNLSNVVAAPKAAAVAASASPEATDSELDTATKSVDQAPEDKAVKMTPEDKSAKSTKDSKKQKGE